MNTTTRVAAVAGSLAAAAAVAAAIVLPVHHTPVSAATSGLSAGAVTKVSGSPGAQHSPGVPTSGPTGSAGAGTGSTGSGSGSGSGTGHGSGSGNGSGSGSGFGSGSGSGSGSGNSGVVTKLPTPTGTVGTPNVPCLIGYTWRKAFVGDYICVTPATAAQAQVDNAAAISRIQPGGGPYGPYTCLQGYVWRQVVPDDYTCVGYAVRSQAWYDNSQANNRIAALSLAARCYRLGLGLRAVEISGSLFNFGPIELFDRHTGTGALVWSAATTATSVAGHAGGAFFYYNPLVMPIGPDYYFVALDVASGRSSSEVSVTTCA